MIVEYIRKGESKVGMLVAYRHPLYEGAFCVGFSLCNKEDVFSRDLGVQLAERRGLASPAGLPKERVPFSVEKALEKFLWRCKSYYKDRLPFGWAAEVTPKLFGWGY
jgi:hypothetical protein